MSFPCHLCTRTYWLIFPLPLFFYKLSPIKILFYGTSHRKKDIRRSKKIPNNVMSYLTCSQSVGSWSFAYGGVWSRWGLYFPSLHDCKVKKALYKTSVFQNHGHLILPILPPFSLIGSSMYRLSDHVLWMDGHSMQLSVSIQLFSSLALSCTIIKHTWLTPITRLVHLKMSVLNDQTIFDWFPLLVLIYLDSDPIYYDPFVDLSISIYIVLINPLSIYRY